MDTEKIIDDLLSADSFDVLEFVAAARLPEDSVDLHTDYDAGVKLNRILEVEKAKQGDKPKKTPIDSLSIGDDYEDTTEEEINALVERIDKSKLTFDLQAISHERRNEIQEELKAGI